MIGNLHATQHLKIKTAFLECPGLIHFVEQRLGIIKSGGINMPHSWMDSHMLLYQLVCNFLHTHGIQIVGGQ